MIVPVDERKHVENSEGVVESTTGHWLTCSNRNVEDLEAYSIINDKPVSGRGKILPRYIISTGMY